MVSASHQVLAHATSPTCVLQDLCLGTGLAVGYTVSDMAGPCNMPSFARPCS